MSQKASIERRKQRPARPTRRISRTFRSVSALNMARRIPATGKIQLVASIVTVCTHPALLHQTISGKQSRGKRELGTGQMKIGECFVPENPPAWERIWERN